MSKKSIAFKRLFAASFLLLLDLLYNPEDGSSKFLENVGELIPENIAPHSRK
jgi:hypothetical protein